MRVPCQRSRCSSLTSKSTGTSRTPASNSNQARESSVSRSVFHPDAFTSDDEDEGYLLDAPSPQAASTCATADFAGDVQELVDIASRRFRRAVLPLGSSDGSADGCMLESVEKWPRSYSPQHLACPFYIRHKEIHFSCLTRHDMQEIMDLKRHLWAAHRQPPYCPICYDTFVLSEDWEDHIRLGSCVPSGRTRPEGISGLQMQQLARRADPRISRETQWLVIWETVFPSVKPPPLGSLTGEVETAVWALRDFWSTDGSRIVSDFLNERQQHNPQLWHDDSDVATIKSVVLGCLIDQLVKTYR